MSVLVNLLPDIRQAKLREHKRRQMAVGLAFLVWAVCGGVLVLLMLYAASQKLSISSLTSKITTEKQQLQSTTGLIDALTAAQHLDSLPALYDQRVYMTKFLAAYSEANPKSVTLNSLAVDGANVLTVSGRATSFSEVSKLARALSGSNVTVGAGAKATNSPYFSDVTISGLTNTGSGVGFSITATLGSGVTNGSK